MSKHILLGQPQVIPIRPYIFTLGDWRRIYRDVLMDDISPHSALEDMYSAREEWKQNPGAKGD